MQRPCLFLCGPRTSTQWQHKHNLDLASWSEDPHAPIESAGGMKFKVGSGSSAGGVVTCMAGEARTSFIPGMPSWNSAHASRLEWRRCTTNTATATRINGSSVPKTAMSAMRAPPPPPPPPPPAAAPAVSALCCAVSAVDESESPPSGASVAGVGSGCSGGGTGTAGV